MAVMSDPPNRHTAAAAAPGILYVVATPIGNLADISQRALDILRTVTYIAAEDTRHSKSLLMHYGIDTPLLSLHEHNEHSRTPKLLADLQAGKAIALISDAGTPLISDPGFPLLRSIRAQGLNAVAIPGPSSVLAALSIAGLPTDRFFFEGFLPNRREARQKRLLALKNFDCTMIFFEAGRRIRDTLEDMTAILGADRPAFIARELTKAFEESCSAPLTELSRWLCANSNRLRGEFVIVVQGAEQQHSTAVTLQTDRLLAALLQELPLKQAVAVAASITGERKNGLYEQALSLQKQIQR